MISIHTALAGCDAGWTFYCAGNFHISIHTALAGCDYFVCTVFVCLRLFQSTQPSQAVTINNATWIGFYCNFNPHSPRRL